MTSEKYCYSYPRPAVTADVVALAGQKKNNLQILLIKRKHPPFQDMWALPGGFVDIDEDIDAAAHRELEEETGLNGVALKQIGAFGKPHRDPRHRTITIAYLACLKQPALVEGRDDAAEAGWFSINHLPLLAFDHGDIIKKALQIWQPPA
ncbi:NUDIX domain-containing protein [Thermophagus xiamenensis]|uniref:8-oxo-dGTP diphosphatase n=1 Tax=Thermophagus xiamenensis TaxID=385682 RepID=A0A1I2ES43_9BACT|nr:NUDIX hydrolase [Thermophagus xiamenensis]SFE95655.1 8-oxo-dGTP diphosphatase [Thermophagus xiamenensis]